MIDEELLIVAMVQRDPPSLSRNIVARALEQL